ncbi:2213_t:CDS:2, partial [Racocetra fulgida]
YQFKLLIRGSNDGFKASEFHEKCDDKGPTLIVLRVKDTNEILGGYNHLNLCLNKDFKNDCKNFCKKLVYSESIRNTKDCFSVDEYEAYEVITNNPNNLN